MKSVIFLVGAIALSSSSVYGVESDVIISKKFVQPSDRQVAKAIKLLQEYKALDRRTREGKNKAPKILKVVEKLMEPVARHKKTQAQMVCNDKVAVFKNGFLQEEGVCDEAIYSGGHVCYNGNPQDAALLINTGEFGHGGGEYFLEHFKVSKDRKTLIGALTDGPNEFSESYQISPCK